MYILWMIAEGKVKGANIFAIKSKDADDISRDLLNYLDDEAKLVDDMEKFVKKLQGILVKLKLTDDRDSLRNEKIIAALK